MIAFSPESEDSPKLDSISARLRLVRIKSGAKTDNDFAKLAGVSRASMSQYLTGKQVPRPPVLHRIAAATGTDIDWLLGHDIRAAALHRMLPDAVFDAETLDAPVNFYLLLIGFQTCREAFKDKPKPTLREALKWVAGPYSLHSTIHDIEVKILPIEE